jgi:hypothetical protein
MKKMSEMVELLNCDEQGFYINDWKNKQEDVITKFKEFINVH